MTPRAKKRLFWGCLVPLIAAVLLLVTVVIYFIANRPYYSAKYHHSGLDQPPSPAPSQPLPILQLESHTCGFLALSTIYQAHDLDPSPTGANLRFRLGTDRPVTPISPDDHTGTLHPDILRVVEQDGFAYSIVDLESATPNAEIYQHLFAGRFALALVKRPETGGLHWIVLSQGNPTGVIVTDSLQPQPTPSRLDDLHLLSVILLTPASNSGSPRSPHLDGLIETQKIPSRFLSPGS